MRNFLIRLVINAIAIAIAASLLPGIDVVDNDLGTYLIIALVFGILNALVKPILVILTCPAVILTLGLFLLVINGLLLRITADLSGGRLIVDGWGAAILGGIIMGLVGMVLESVLGLDDNKRKTEVVVVDRR
jgi:putative membrane protein